MRNKSLDDCGDQPVKLKLLIFILFITAFTLKLNAQPLAVATYNVRYDNPADIGNLWKDRAPVIANLIRFHDFDIVGTQEAWKNQIADLDESLPEYNWYGVGRNDGIDSAEFSAIFYKKDKFKLLKSGNFWLSTTPEKPSFGWDAVNCKRVCSWVQLQRIKDGRKFYVFNTHFDHEGATARIESSKLVLQKIREIAGDAPVLFTGDLNTDHESESYNILANSGLLIDTYQQVKHPYVNNTSFNGFGRSFKGDRIIDHVFTTKHFSTHKWGLLTDTYYGKFPSDHFPVVAVVTLK